MANFIVQDDVVQNDAGPIVAIMQPYFVPYAGYFSLFAAADLLVIYDSVQFPREGYVHRNRLPDRNGALRWLKMPLEKAKLGTRIDELVFRTDAREHMIAQFAAFPQLEHQPSDTAGLVDALLDTSRRPSEYIEELLRRAAAVMGLPWRIERSSTMKLPENLSAEDRVIAIAKAFGARTYVNTSGGRALYSSQRFEDAGLKLRFLPQYDGPSVSILSRLLDEPAERVAADIYRNARLLP
ncbi:MAG: WbqC family protein [Janthinobacterium lividum]